MFTGQKNNPWSKHEIERSIEHIGLKRMTRFRDKWFFNILASKSRETLDKLLSERSSCIKIVLTVQNRWRCISYVLRRTGGDGVLIYSSQSEAIILTHTSKEYLDYKHCKDVKIIHSVGCEEYIADHIMAMQMHQRPSHLDLIEDSGVDCIVAYHYESSTKKCRACMQKTLGGKVVHDIITPYWLLLPTSGTNCKVHPILFQSY